MIKKKENNSKLGAEIVNAITASDDLAKVNKALQDVFGESFKGRIKSIELEIDPKKVGRFDDDGGWSGNIYRYSF